MKEGAGYLKSARRLAPILWTLLFLFILRVVGQLIVNFGWQGFLPPMTEWYSGMIPYPWLVLSQILIILLYAKVCSDFTRGQGYFVTPKARLGKGLIIFGALYLGAMVIRYAIRMSLQPEERWFGGSIPIIFHWVLSAFILLVGTYHWSHRAGK